MLAKESPADIGEGERDRRLTEIVTQERGRLRDFIRRRVSNAGDAEDILQDVLFEFTAAYRLPEQIEQVGAWLFRVARNRIIDRFRKKREEQLPDHVDEEEHWLDHVLPDEHAGPEAAYARGVLVEALLEALEELSPEQRRVFISHEIDGLSFREMSEQSGVAVNTLLARKRYAVRHLRESLRDVYEELDL